MTDFRIWPTRKGKVSKREHKFLTLPAEWLGQFNLDIYDIKMETGAHNDTHALVIVAHEYAERIRKEKENG